MSRFTAAVTAALLLCLLLAACQSAVLPAPTQISQPDQTPQTGPTPSPASRLPTLTPEARPTTVPLELQVKPEALKGTTIHFWHPWSGETAKQVQEMVDQFNHENVWGIRVVVDALGGSAVLFDQVSAALETPGQAPAVVAASPDALANWHQQRQAVVDLNVYIRSTDWGLTQAEIEDFNPAVWQALEIDGARLGIPAENSAQVLFYNQTWARELGFTSPPETPTEFQQQACAAADTLVKDGDKTNDGMGGWVIDRDAMTLLSWFAAYGAQAPSADVRYSFNTPESAAAFAYLRQLFDKSCAWLSRNPLPYEYFATRRALFFSGDLSEIALQQKVSAHLSSRDTWTVLPFPSQSGQPVLLSSGSAYALLDQKPADQLAGWLLVRWLILPRNQARLIKAGLSLPVGQEALKELAGFEKSSPQWAAAVKELDRLIPPPSLPDWGLARNILEDAGWQLLQPAAQTPAAVLKQLDDTLADILQHQSQP